jgi:hypothetical protein
MLVESPVAAITYTVDCIKQERLGLLICELPDALHTPILTFLEFNGDCKVISGRECWWTIDPKEVSRFMERLLLGTDVLLAQSGADG